MNKFLIYFIRKGWFIFLISINPFLFAQNFSYTQFTTENGLPSNEVYDILQDQKGYLWMATDRGLAKYDGYEFKIFTTANGLHNSSILYLYEDSFGNMWVKDLEDHFCYIRNDTVINLSINIKNEINRISKKLKNRLIFYSLYVNKKKDIFLGTNKGRFKIINYDSLIKIADTTYINEGFISAYLINKTLYTDKNKKVVISSDSLNFKNTRIRTSISKNYLALNNRLLKWDTDRYKLHNWIHCEFGRIFEMDDHIFVSASKLGLLDLNKTDTTLVLSERDISNVYIDKESNYWISTLNKGIFKYPSFFIKTKEIDYEISDIITFKDDIYYWSNPIQMVKCIKNKEFNYQTTQNNQTKRLYSYQDTLYLNERKNVYVNLITFKKFVNGNNRGKIIHKTKNEIWKVLPKFSIEDAKTFQLKFHPNISGRIFCYLFSNNHLLFGTSKGLYSLDTSTFVSVKLFNNISSLNTRINSILQINNSIICGTDGSGIVIVNKDSSYAIIDKNSGLKSNQINHLHLDTSNNTVWASSNMGVSRIEYITHTHEKKITNFGYEDGLTANQVNKATVMGDTVYLATSKGINFFYKHLQKNNTLPFFHLDKITISNRDTSIFSNYDLVYTQNSIRLDFTGISLKKQSSITYKYRFLSTNSDSLWNKKKERFLIFKSLTPGKYTLEIKAVNRDNVESKIKRIHFSISPPFWKTWWFITLVFISLVFIVFLIIKNRIKELKEKARLYKNQNKLDTELNIVRQQALNSQMNPHFIFNSLNSIQNYILKKDILKSNEYLSKFSNLMRATLDNSQNILVTLEEEINTLELYLLLEKLRFEEKLSYEINVDENICTDMYKVPPLLFQPFIENSIWHGIMHKEGKGILKISFQEKDKDNITCIIEDNGIGRKMALQLKNKNKIKHKSTGLSITDKRISLMKKIHNQNFSYQLIDLTDSLGNPLGTQVKFVIPIIIENASNNS